MKKKEDLEEVENELRTQKKEEEKVMKMKGKTKKKR